MLFSYLAALTGMDPIVKTRSHIATHFAQQNHSIQLWKESQML